MTWLERLPFIVFAIGVVGLLIVFPLYLLLGGLRTFALRPLERCFEGLRLRETRGPGDVRLVYSTYRGLFFWVTQQEHDVFAPVEDAERLLGRLLRFNLTWGLLSYGMLFLPFLAIGNYYAQRRSIRDQAAAL